MKGRFFVDVDPAAPDRAELDAAGARHVRALRLTAGAALCAIVGPGRERAATIASLDRDRVVLALGEDLTPSRRDPRRRRTLAIALGDLPRMDLIVEKATELGATAIQPFVAERSQVRDVPASRLERWRRIARAACEQCGRTIEPEIRACWSLDDLLASVGGDALLWLLDPAGASPLATAGAAQSTKSGAGHAAAAADVTGAHAEHVLVVGPEGGLAATEVAALRARGARAIALGSRILRFETAAIAALAASLACFPDEE